MLGRRLAEAERARFVKYLDLLLKWQRVHRLVGSSDPDWIADQLFLDSLVFLRVLPASTGRLLDLGAGAGFPGVPIAIVRPEIEVTLMEGRQRRASFLAAVVRELPLVNARVRAERAETARSELAESFDAVVMRCAGALADVVPLALAFTRPGGLVVLSGPPKARATTVGRWVEVEGTAPDSRRRFLIAEK